jgi:hypothetical protein
MSLKDSFVDGRDGKVGRTALGVAQAWEIGHSERGLRPRNPASLVWGEAVRSTPIRRVTSVGRGVRGGA